MSTGKIKKMYRVMKVKAYTKIHNFITGIKERPFKKIYNKSAITKGREQAIPKTVYQTFKVNSFGKSLWKEIHRFRHINPDFDFLFFDDALADYWMKENFGDKKIYHIYQNIKFGPAKADIWRYCILYKKGGYYFDIKSGCEIPLTDLHNKDSEAVISYETNPILLSPSRKIFDQILEPSKYVIQWGMAFTPRHPVLKCVIKNIEDDYSLYKQRTFDSAWEAIIMFTGPGQFTKSVRQTMQSGTNHKIEQLGINFNGHGNYSMRGAHSRFLISDTYTKFKNCIIVS